MKNQISTVKGTRDFYPDEMSIRRWLYQKIGEVSTKYGYVEYDGPFIEKIELYAAKSGEELVKQQAFVFTDRGGELVTLRPELTPSLARMVVKKQNELTFPLRWWSFGPFWRYEKPQRGRTREFFQWNIDMIGVNSPSADAELIAICAHFFKSLGLTPDQVQIKLNHRKLLEQKLVELGIPLAYKTGVFTLIDRIEKLKPNEWHNNAIETGLSEDQIVRLHMFLENGDLWQESEELVSIISLLNSYGVGEYVKFTPKIVRGLDYYTGVVFEAWDLEGVGRAILGGGHYDNLVADVGGDVIAGVGFAMGDVMISIMLDKYGLIPSLNQYAEVVLLTKFNEQNEEKITLLSAELREHGLNVMVYPEAVKLQKQLKYADRLSIPVVVIIGPDEEASGCVTIKDLKKLTQVTVPMELTTAVIKDMLAAVNGL